MVSKIGSLLPLHSHQGQTFAEKFAVWNGALLLIQLFYSPLSGTTWVSRYQKKHSPTQLTWWSTFLYQLLPSTTIHSMFRVQFTCLTVFLHNLSPSPLWSTSWSQIINHLFLEWS